MSLRNVARILGISPKYLSLLLNGKRPWRGNLKERYEELVNTFVNTAAGTGKTEGERNVSSVPEKRAGGAEGIRTPDPLHAKRIVSYLKAHSHIQISSLCTRSCSWVYKWNLKKYLKNLEAYK